MQRRGFDSHLTTNLHAATLCATLCAGVLATVKDRPRITAADMPSSQILKGEKGQIWKAGKLQPTSTTVGFDHWLTPRFSHKQSCHYLNQKLWFHFIKYCSHITTRNLCSVILPQMCGAICYKYFGNYERALYFWTCYIVSLSKSKRFYDHITQFFRKSETLII